MAIVDNSIDRRAWIFVIRLRKFVLIGMEVVQFVDNGQGIPVDMHESGKPALEVNINGITCGGKFTIDGGYAISVWWASWVGVSVVNALSSLDRGTGYRDEVCVK